MPSLVSVGCKLPCGLLLEIKGKPRVPIKGTAVKWGEAPVIVPGGYAITPDVDEDFMTAWMKLNAGLDIVEKGIIFVAPKYQDALAKSKDHAEVKTGLEGIDRDKLPNDIQSFGVTRS